MVLWNTKSNFRFSFKRIVEWRENVASSWKFGKTTKEASIFCSEWVFTRGWTCEKKCLFIQVMCTTVTIRIYFTLFLVTYISLSSLSFTNMLMWRKIHYIYQVCLKIGLTKYCVHNLWFGNLQYWLFAWITVTSYSVVSRHR